MLPKFNKNEEREKQKGGERKQIEIPLPKMLPVQLKKNAIAATPLPKKEKKKFVLAIVAIRLPKM